MNAQSILREFAAHGASVYPEVGLLRVTASQPVPAELMDALRSRKPEILALLRGDSTPPESGAGSLATAIEEAGAAMWRAVLAGSPQRHEDIATFRALAERWKVWYTATCERGDSDAAYVENIALRANLEAQRDQYRRARTKEAML
jgi:hypothetical protein